MIATGMEAKSQPPVVVHVQMTSVPQHRSTEDTGSTDIFVSIC